MTSGSLFFKLIWKDLKQRIWCPILLCVVFFLSMEVTCLMMFQTIDAYGSGYYQTKLSYFRDDFLMAGAAGGVVTFFMVGSAILCGLSSFTYLNSKKQIDLYHSLPVHRSILFFSRFVSGLLCFIVPFVFNLLTTFIIAVGKNAVDGTVFGRLFIFAAFEIVFFLSIYATTVLAVMLTGNFVLNAIGCAVLLLYSPILWATVCIMNSTFYKTFVEMFYKRPFCLSPVQDMIECFMRIQEKQDYELIVSYAPAMNSLVIECIAIVVLVIVNWRLFLARPSEAAGKSIVFPIAEPVIKTLFLIPVSLACGVFFKSASSSEHGFAWFMFGSVFGFLFIGIVMEIIYRLDIKSALCHWKYLILNLALMLIIIAIYKMDLLGFDSYIPDKDSIESMAVSVDMLDSQMNYAYYESYISQERYRLENMNMTELDVPYALCQYAIDNPIILEEQEDDQTDYQTTSQYMQAMSEQSQSGYTYMTVAYKQKNGKIIYRSYLIDALEASTFDMLNKLYCMEEYKKGVFPIFEEKEKPYVELCCNMAFDRKTLRVNSDMMNEFLPIYREELKKLTLQEIHEQLPVGSIDLYEKGMGLRGNYYNDSYGYPLYASCVNTLAWLKEHGIDYSVEQRPVKLLSVQTWNYNQSYETDEGWMDTANIIYEDEKVMKEILSHVALTYDINMGAIMPVEDWMDVDIQYESADGIMYKTFYFKKGEIPDFIIKDLDEFVPNEEEMKY